MYNVTLQYHLLWAYWAEWYFFVIRENTFCIVLSQVSYISASQLENWAECLLIVKYLSSLMIGNYNNNNILKVEYLYEKK